MKITSTASVFLIASALCCTTVQNANARNESDTIGAPENTGRLQFQRMSKDVADILNKYRPVENHSVPMPKFVVKSANNNFIMTIGGTINPILGFDIGNNLYKQDGAGISFVTQSIPVPATSGHKGDFFINPLNGDVDMQIVGLANSPNEISGYLKVGTNGIDSKIVLKRAYVSWRGITAGMKLTLFQDDNACQPSTIDPEGPSGTVSNTAYEVGYKSKSYNGFRFAAALDMPTFYSSNGYYRGKDYPLSAEFGGKKVIGETDQLIPDIPVWVEYSFSDWNRIRVSALLRNFQYRDLVSDKTRHAAGWGVMLSGNVQPAKPVILYYQLAYGHGIGSYLQDISGLPVSFVPKNDDPGRVQASPMMGVNLGVTWNPTSKLQFNAMVSESRIWDVADYCNALDESQNYKYALYGAVNCFYNITPYLQWGIEYVWGHRQTWNAGGAHDSRIQTQLAFSF